MLKEIKADLKSDKEYYRNKREYYRTHKEAIKQLASELTLLLPKDTPVTGACDGYNITVRVAGGPAELKSIFRAFRKLGYDPSARPGIKPEESFSSYFRREEGGPEFYLYFSSTICKRIKIGSKMVEQAVYETVCE